MIRLLLAAAGGLFVLSLPECRRCGILSLIKAEAQRLAFSRCLDGEAAPH